MRYIYIYIYIKTYIHTHVFSVGKKNIYKFRILKGIQCILQLIIKLCFLNTACSRASLVTAIPREGEKREAEKCYTAVQLGEEAAAGPGCCQIAGTCWGSGDSCVSWRPEVPFLLQGRVFEEPRKAWPHAASCCSPEQHGTLPARGTAAREVFTAHFYLAGLAG